MTTTIRPPAGHTRTDTQASAAGGFNLHALTLEVVRTHPSPDLRVLADAVLDRIPPEHYRTVLALVLRGYVGDVVRAQRSSSDPTTSTTDPTCRPSGRSWKRDRIRAAWRRDRQPGADGTPKFLEQFTYDDLIAAATRRRDIAKANTIEAERYEHAAALLAASGASELGQLDDDTVAAVLGGAA